MDQRTEDIHVSVFKFIEEEQERRQEFFSPGDIASLGAALLSEVVKMEGNFTVEGPDCTVRCKKHKTSKRRH
jgi:hypothetical protein